MKSIKLFDIDGTLLNTGAMIYVNGVAHLPSEAGNFNPSDIDWSEFNDRQKLQLSLDNSEKLMLFRMLKKLNHLIKKAFITARSQEGMLERWFIRQGILGDLYAVNDRESRAECYPEMSDWKKWNTAERKAKIIEFYCKKYDLVEFYDDEIENLTQALKLGFKNLILWKVERDDTISLFDENYKE